jgi:hypothetical protein
MDVLVFRQGSVQLPARHTPTWSRQRKCSRRARDGWNSGVFNLGGSMYRKQPQPKPLAVAVMAALISLTALPALAQDAAQDKKEEAKTLDALVVTAQKREEAMQDVPIVVTACRSRCCRTPACATSRTCRSWCRA